MTSYAYSLLGATETEAAVVCATCGVLVADTDAHDGWHDLLRKVAKK